MLTSLAFICLSYHNLLMIDQTGRHRVFCRPMKHCGFLYRDGGIRSRLWGNPSDFCRSKKSCSIISGIGTNQSCKWDIEWDLCAPGHWAAKEPQRRLLPPFGGTNSCNQQSITRQESSGRGLEEQFEMVAGPDLNLSLCGSMAIGT
jgi:hypothetical protein